MSKIHSFHIPVLGIGYTIDTPLKVSRFGIDSVVSLVDDTLMEKLRKMYSEKFKIPYQEISDKIEDFRAKRISSYLDMMQQLAEEKFQDFKASSMEKASGIKDYFNMLPDSAEIKKEFIRLKNKHIDFSELKQWFSENISRGSIDVNIMTKVDRESYRKGEKLGQEFNEAHAALRGFAQSKLESSIVLSAGMNPRLYNYMEQFEDFYPDENGYIKKKIVIKVSDYRSALIQGKYFAKKGIWVSEYRIESGLNCGGHAFATDGFLMGPVLEEFAKNREELVQSVYQVLVPALEKKNKKVPSVKLPLRITAQGGVGTAEEHQFLLDKYNLDSVGWGTPFLLVPEATTVDEKTMKQLSDAKEDDLYLSNISPLGVLFNSLRGNTKDEEKEDRILSGKPGSPCPRKYLAFNKEFSDRGLCTASITYQQLKIKELDQEQLMPAEYLKRYRKITEKSCICVGLGTSTQMAHDIDVSELGSGVSVCPGPNMAYFSGKHSLKEMVAHIYGKTNIIKRNNRPNMFIKELNMYIDYLKDKIDEQGEVMNKAQEKYFAKFSANLSEGINYYKEMFENVKGEFEEIKESVLKDLRDTSLILNDLENTIKGKQPMPVMV
jgi:hypothetical protein